MQRRTSIKSLFSFLTILIVANGLQAQLDSIWPGDANNNGIVNGVDALYLGVAMGAAGPPRTSPVPDWVNLPAPNPWSNSFPSGLNYYFADCNGNGRVELTDLEEAVVPNFLRTHRAPGSDNFANARTGEGPQFELRPTLQQVSEGTEIIVEVYLRGQDGGLLTDFYGVSIEMSYVTTRGTPVGSTGYTADFSWIDPSPNTRNSLELFENDAPFDINKSYLTLCRTDQRTVVDSGKIGEVSIIMEDIVLGLEVDTLTIQVDSIMVIDEELNVVPTVPDTAKVVIFKSINDLNPITDNISTQVYPNPAGRMAFLSVMTELRTCKLYNACGQVIPLRLEQTQSKRYELHWPEDLPVGVYFLRLVTQDGRTQSQKLLIH